MTSQVLSHIPAVHFHLAPGHIIETGDQVHQGGLAAAGAPDDPHGTAFGDGKIQISYGFGTSGIAKGHVMESHGRSPAHRLKGSVSRGTGQGAFHLQDTLDTACTGCRFIQRDHHTAQFHQFDDHLGHIVVEGHHIPLGHGTHFHPEGSLADQDHCGQVHQ